MDFPIRGASAYSMLGPVHTGCARRELLLAGLSSVFRLPAEITDAADLSLFEASQRVRRKLISPVELTTVCLERIQRLNPKLNAFITITAERALSQAKALEKEWLQGRWRGPLHGIPIALKDIIDTAGVRTTAGSAVFKNRVPDEDAEVVRRALNAGAIILGKLNTAEFAFSDTSVISHFGPVHNPWNLNYDAGGSSSGPAAAVAGRLCYGALGTDTGASVRVPAARCGVTGLRPTYGRVSTRGVIPLFNSLDTVGPICRSVEDTSLLLQAIAGYDPADPGSFEIPVGNYHAALLARTSTLRIGIPRTPFFSELDPEIERAVSDALRVIERLTKRLVEVHLPARPQMSFGCEAWNYHRELLAKVPDAYSPLIRERIQMQAADCGPAYVDSLRNLELTRRAIRSTFVDVDLLITPTTAILPKSIEYTLREEAQHRFVSSRNTYPISVWGLPAISVPCGFSQSRLPIGLQIIGARFRETDVLTLAHAYQRATEWHKRTPDL